MSKSPELRDIPWYKTTMTLCVIMLFSTAAASIPTNILGGGYRFVSVGIRIIAVVHASTAFSFFPTMLHNLTRSYRQANNDRHRWVGRIALGSAFVAAVTIPPLVFPGRFAAPESGFIGSIITIPVWVYFIAGIWKTYWYAKRGAYQLHRQWAARVMAAAVGVIAIRLSLIVLFPIVLAIFPNSDDLDPEIWGTVGLPLGIGFFVGFALTISIIEVFIQRKYVNYPLLSKVDHLGDQTPSDALELSGQMIPLTANKQLDGGVHELTFSLPDSIKGSIHYAVGRHVLIDINGQYRPYTLLPPEGSGGQKGATRSIRVAVKGVGALSKALVGMKSGESVSMRGPVGSIVWDEPVPRGTKKVVLLSGGVGITGVYPVAKAVLGHASGSDVEVVLGVSGTGAETYVADLMDGGFSNLSIKNSKGRMTREFISAAAGPGSESTLVIVCGPVGMNNGVREELEGLGHASKQIFCMGTDER